MPGSKVMAMTRGEEKKDIICCIIYKRRSSEEYCANGVVVHASPNRASPRKFTPLPTRLPVRPPATAF